jgi:hypothetical protein
MTDPDPPWRTELPHNQLKDRPLCTATAVEVCRTLEGVDMDIRRTPGTQLVNDHTGEVVSSFTQFQPYA